MSPFDHSCIIGGSRGVLHMLQSKARWRILEQDETLASKLSEELRVSVLAARLLVHRGITDSETAKRFLLKEEPEFHNPFLLKGMEETVKRINVAVESNERILVFGDYDADGVSSTSVMLTALRMYGAECDYYIPNRFTEGYGPNNPALEQAKAEGYSLVITVDTGISALEQGVFAKEIGLDFIVTDHHEPPPSLPEAYAIINPKQPECSYPFKELAGVGVAFKVAHALLGRVPYELLEFAVIGTIADLVPLVDENRLIAKKGLHALESSSRPGIRALKEVCGIKQETIEADHVGFGMGPRLNAAGRLDSADPAVELLLAENSDLAQELAEKIDQLNKERQTIVNKMTEEAIMLVDQESTVPEVIVIAKEGWNAGVIGIVASRIVEKYYRPTIVMSIDLEKGVAKGSARSIDGFDMFQELSKNRDILPHFGGHPMAAGMTLAQTDILALRDRLIAQAQETMSDEDFTPITEIDLVADVEDITLDVIGQIQELAPFGVANRKPTVLIQDAEVADLRRIGSDSNHLKLQFAGAERPLDGIAFRMGHLFEEITPQAKLSAVGTLSVNEWNGRVKPQLMIADLAVKDWQLFDWRSVKPTRLIERMGELPATKMVPVAFQSETKKRLELESTIFDAHDPLPNIDGAYLVLLDLPDDRSGLQKLFKGVGTPSRIYVVFSEEEEAFFQTNPNRDQFKWYYAFLKKRGTFLTSDMAKLEKHKGWSAHTVQFMTQVFSELGFVEIEEGQIVTVEFPEKKGLEHSNSYRQKQEQAWLENEFLYASYHQLKEWFGSMIETDANKKEESI